MSVKKGKAESSLANIETQDLLPVQSQTEAELSQPQAVNNKRSGSKIFLFITIAIIAVVGIMFYFYDSPEQEELAATINGKAISMKELNQLYDTLPEQYKVFSTKESILNQLIEKEVLFQEAKNRGIEISNDIAANQLSIAIASSGISKEEFFNRLAAQNKTEDELINEYAEQLTIQELIKQELTNKIEITEEEIKKYYNENKNTFKVGEKVTVKHILIGDTDLTKEQQNEKANMLLKEINTQNFCNYTSNYSTDIASIANCGEYTFSKDDALVQEFKDFSFNQLSGKIGTVDTQFGTHIIWTIKKAPQRTLPYKEVSEEVKKRILSAQLQEAYPKYYEGLKQKSKIDVFYIESSIKQ